MNPIKTRAPSQPPQISQKAARGIVNACLMSLVFWGIVFGILKSVL